VVARSAAAAGGELRRDQLAQPRHDRIDRDAEVAQLALGDRVARPLEGQEQQRVVGRRAGGGTRPHRCQQRQLAAPLGAVEGAGFRVGGD